MTDQANKAAILEARFLDHLVEEERVGAEILRRLTQLEEQGARQREEIAKISLSLAKARGAGMVLTGVASAAAGALGWIASKVFHIAL